MAIDGELLNRLIPGLPEDLLSEIATLVDLRDDKLHVDRYQIVDFLGKGRTGIVLKGVCGRRGNVAIKTMRQRSDVSLVRFNDEITIAERIYHPNLVPVLDHGHSSNGLPFLVMPTIVGEPLSQRLCRGSLSTVDALTLALDMADGLTALEAQGIIHRDLSPRNVFLIGASGRGVIGDFGMARMVDAEGRGTCDGNFYGSTYYAAPEQVQYRAADVCTHSDLFSIGAILFECLTGTKAFPCDTPVEYALLVLGSYVPKPPEHFSWETNKVGSALIEIAFELLNKSVESRKEKFPHGAKSLFERLLNVRSLALTDQWSADGDFFDSFKASELAAGLDDGLATMALRIEKYLRKILRATSGTDDPDATVLGSVRLQLDSSAGGIKVICNPHDSAHYNVLFGGINSGTFLAYNAPFRIEEKEGEVRNEAKRTHIERLQAIKMSNYLFLDEESFGRARRFFNEIDEESMKDSDADGHLVYWESLNAEERRQLEEFSYFVGYRNNRPRCVLYVINPSSYSPELAILFEGNEGLANVLSRHFTMILEQAMRSGAYTSPLSVRRAAHGA